MGKKHFFLLFLLLIIGVLASFVYVSSAKTSEKEICIDCNVILISIDTLRKNNLGVYGYDRDTSPNLDEYSKDALVFDNFYSTSSWTIPAHSSMLASDYPHSLKMQKVSDKLAEDVVTISDVLGSSGYRTVGWSNNNTFISKRWNLNKGFSEFYNVDVDEKVEDANLIFPDAIEWIRKNNNNKFFAFIHTFQVHDPYCPPEEFDIFRGDYKGEENCIDIVSISEVNRGDKFLSKDDKLRHISLYDGEILYTDYFLGKLFKALKEEGLDDKTIIVITSDHGEEFGERGLWGTHTYTLYNELVNVPLIIKAPNLEKGRVDRNISMIDIAPTILDLIGVEKSSEFKGISIRDEQERYIYFETSNSRRETINNLDKAYAGFGDIKPENRRDKEYDIEKEGVLYKNWKLILNRLTDEIELYDMSQDFKEENNISTENPDIVESLRKHLRNN